MQQKLILCTRKMCRAVMTSGTLNLKSYDRPGKRTQHAVTTPKAKPPIAAIQFSVFLLSIVVLLPVQMPLREKALPSLWFQAKDINVFYERFKNILIHKI